MKIHTYSSTERAFLVNSFILEGARGLVVVDTQFLVSAANALREQIRALAKPLLAIVITHPHPDHFNGTDVLCEDGAVPVYATQPTIDGIRAIEADKRAFWTPQYGGDYPARTYFPDRIIEPGQRLQFDDIAFTVDDLGAGEASEITVLWFEAEAALIASDLLYHCVHPWLAEGRSRAWLMQLQRVQERYPEAQVVHAGHGGAGTLASLKQQARYIELLRDRVSGAVVDGKLDAAVARQIGQDLRALYPGYPLEFLIELNIAGIAQELAVEAAER